MRLRDLFAPRLALRFYLVGLAQMVVVAAGFIAIAYASRPPVRGPIEERARQAAGEVQGDLGDPAALASRLAALQRAGATFTVVAPDGSVVASGMPGAPRCTDRPPGRPPPPPFPPPDGLVPFGPEPPPHEPGGPPPPGAPGRHCAIVPLAFPNGDGQLHYFTEPLEGPPSLGLRVIPLVLLVVGISSVLLARSLLRPLQELGKAARALGTGDLAARARLDRRDELGDVSRAFDEMAERVAQLLRAEKELIANISHELRTPLARIRVALDLAAEGDADVARESLAEIAEDLNELERLIEDVLTAARLELAEAGPSSGIPPLRVAPVDTRELVEHAAARFRSAHPKRPLVLKLDEHLPQVEGDRVLLRRVVDNLLENAHKYTDAPDATIELSARHDHNVIIEVADSGIGISAEDLPKVFRPFFRADKSRSRATGGLGLGLALAKRIADAHHGSLTITSTVGEGTRARFELPVA